MEGRQGFTLMELLVVLLIIGILSTVALRTIDATRDRSLFDQTSAEMNKLVQAIVGNPDLAYDGRRVDFGYYGDMEQLPPGPTLRDLVYNSTGNAAWRGPYFKLMSAGDTISYLYDEWGGLYDYHPNTATIHTEANHKFPMTVKIVDDTAQLHDNIISGSFLDRDGNPPGDTSSSYQVRLWYNNPTAHGGTAFAMVHPARGGYYEIALHPSDPIWPRWEVPIGTKKLQAIILGQETLTRYVTVAPRSHVVADFKFTKSFAGKLRLVLPVQPIDTSGFFIRIVSDYSDSSVTINWLQFDVTSAVLYMRDFQIESERGQGFPKVGMQFGAGPGATVDFQTPVTIPPDGSVELQFRDFHVDPQGQDGPANVDNKIFQIRFSDGSRITVNP